MEKKGSTDKESASITGVRPKLIWQGVSGRRSLKRPHGLSGTTLIQLEKVSMNTQKKTSVDKETGEGFGKHKKKLRSSGFEESGKRRVI